MIFQVIVTPQIMIVTNVIDIVFNVYCVICLAIMLKVGYTHQIDESKRNSVVFNVGYIIVALINTHNRQKMLSYDWMDYIFYFLVITGSISRWYALSITSKKLTNGKGIQQRSFSMGKRELSKVQN